MAEETSCLVLKSKPDASVPVDAGVGKRRKAVFASTRKLLYANGSEKVISSVDDGEPESNLKSGT